jgi:hypothetical protein
MRSSALALGLILVTSGAHCAETITRPAKVHTPPIRTAQKWNPLWCLGNADDPQPPEWFRPGARGRRTAWQMRNPLHNFTHYIIGVTDKDTLRTGLHPSRVFAPGGGWNWAFTRTCHGIVLLPFVSYDGARCRFYLGWRESGNFGGKVNLGRRPQQQ